MSSEQKHLQKTIYIGVLALSHYIFDSVLLIICATDYFLPRFYFPVNLPDASKKKLSEQHGLVCSKGCSPWLVQV